MRKIILLLSCGLLAACGSGGGSPGGSGGGSVDPVVTTRTGEYGDLSGLGLKAFVVAAIPRLAEEPDLSRAPMARALDQKWNLNCNSGCEISRKDKQ